MELLNGLIPGESMGMPDQMSGLLGNPLLNIGLGILANNRGNYGSFGAAVGQGGLQGLQNIQRQKALDTQSKIQQREAEMRQRDFEQRQKQFDTQEAAHLDFDTKFPEYKGLSRLNPQAALKIAYPDAMQKSVDPYYTPIPLENGLARFNNRTGDMELVTLPNGQTVMKASDSPRLQGQIQGAKSEAQAQWKPNTDIPGVVSTDAQVAGAARGRLPAYQGNTPYPMTWNGQPMGAPGTTATDMQEGDANIQLRDPARPNRSGLGLSVPTPAQLAADKKAAELQAESTATSKIQLPNAIQQAEQTSQLIDDLIKHPGLKPAVGLSSKLDPRNYIPGTSATDFKVRLDQLQGKQFLQAFESLKGGGVITDLEGKKATDAIARMNTSQSEQEFVKSAREFQKIIADGLERSKAKAGVNIMPNNERMPNKVRKYNPKTGRIE